MTERGVTSLRDILTGSPGEGELVAFAKRVLGQTEEKPPEKVVKIKEDVRDKAEKWANDGGLAD